jgi:hypothetical protein
VKISKKFGVMQKPVTHRKNDFTVLSFFYAQKPAKIKKLLMLFYVLSVSSCFFFESSENIKFVQEILQKSDHKQQETRSEGEIHNLE